MHAQGMGFRIVRKSKNISKIVTPKHFVERIDELIKLRFLQTRIGSMPQKYEVWAGEIKSELVNYLKSNAGI